MSLVVVLDAPLPAGLPEGARTAVFCAGTCFDSERELAGLALAVDGRRHAVAAAGMPRPDAAARDPRAFRSGFWGIVPVEARGEAVEVAVVARLAGGGEAVAPLGRIPVTARDDPPTSAAAAPPASSRAAAGRIAVCMATFEPDPDLFRAQVESLRAQTDRDWTCVISDDGSSPAHREAIRAAIGGDERFTLVPGEQRLGFYRNFERALRLAPPEAELIALCDQDDRWHPDKLTTLRAALGSATLVYSDQRLVGADGAVLRDTLWRGRRNNHTDIASLLVANSITGAACLFRRELAALALPFPDTPGLQFHDHWIGLVALAAGDVAYVERPLYDYVQHGGAVFGAVGEDDPAPAWRRLLGGGRGAYFRGYLPRSVLARTVLLRCGDRMAPGKRRALERFIAAERSPLALAWLAARPLRTRRETLGSEAGLVRGIAWRWAVEWLATGARAPGRRPLDASLPGLLAYQQTRLRRWRARV